ncbi:MAG: polyphosphate polymerase domain-containing protein [Clostridia bacterium]|nr:polyphosphate polymerase domain-containing protein [Clostridia bacterium]
MAISIFKRYEKKFLISKEQYELLIPKLLEYMEPDEYCRNGQNYTIYNIYYDTKDNSLIRHSLAKPYYKEKLRIRSYFVPKSDKDIVFVELKKKIGGVVNKRRVVLTLKEAIDFVHKGIKPVSEDYIQVQVINEIEHFLNMYTVVPTAYISYNRNAFFGKDDKEFRVTFDSNITTRRKALSLEKGDFGDQLLENGQYLMEVKISAAMPMWLANALSELGIYSTSFSKYGFEYQKNCIGKAM